MGFFLMVYSPALAAFGLGFYVLMPCEILVFESPWKSGLKILAMLIGELEFEGNFMDPNTVEKSQDIILIQIMSVCFLCFGSIVIMNLLVGLTVNEIEEIKSEAKQLRLKE